MQSSASRKALFGLMKAIGSPRESLSWIVRGHLAKDSVFVSQSYWFSGELPRAPLCEILPGIDEVEVRLPRGFDRKSGISISVEEACHLGAIARFIKARNALEIGTYDGNTALVLASNGDVDGTVVTVDLPPDFGIEMQDSFTYSGIELNLTPRNQLGRQYRGHCLSSRIKQVYGDSARIDWYALGAPFDLVFIDGCHSEAYVQSDSENAMKHLATGGVVVWHDYGMIPEVSKVVDRLAREMSTIRVYALQGTRLAIALT